MFGNDNGQQTFNDFKDLDSYEQHHPYFTKKALRARKKHRAVRFTNPLHATLGEGLMDLGLLLMPVAVGALIIYAVDWFVSCGLTSSNLMP